MGRTNRAPRAVALCVVVAGVLSGCGAGVERVPVQGVDLLVVPTPSPDPNDFVAAIDNPWLPYAADTTWTYDLVVGFEEGNQQVIVEPDTVEIAGIDATAVTTRTQAGALSETTTDYFAQDSAGNVWWLGRDGQWEAGVDGAEAGLAMPARPRIGDGWRLGLAPGVMEDRVTLLAITDEDVVVLELRSDLQPGSVTTLTYERGIGLIQADPLGVGRPALTLATGPDPDPLTPAEAPASTR